MLTELKNAGCVAGLKQVRRAVTDQRARKVFLAKDADPMATEPLDTLCRENRVAVEWVPSRRELGSACGLHVGCAAAALL